MEPFIGQIVMFGGNFAPRGWAFCEGQLLPIAQNTALFSLIGTIYGGDGRTTFALPDLRGRAPIHMGQGPGLSPRKQGEKGGEENVTLTTINTPSHNHQYETIELGDMPLQIDETGSSHFVGVHQGKHHTATNNVGNSQSHNNMQPYIAMNYIIALQGTFPSRS